MSDMENWAEDESRDYLADLAYADKCLAEQASTIEKQAEQIVLISDQMKIKDALLKEIIELRDKQARQIIKANSDLELSIDLFRKVKAENKRLKEFITERAIVFSDIKSADKFLQALATPPQKENNG